jgi:D-tagatose-1,6-bisphosphate aldolase subunit GatZ/KbaZ
MTASGEHILKRIRENKCGNASGIFSVCSSNKYVIEAAIKDAKKNNNFLLIEATSNQVNQFGGYTGFTPSRFRDEVRKICYEFDFPEENLILGGDHLGPHVWKNESEEEAMLKAKELVTAYVSAGYIKIHLDASSKCKTDGSPDFPLEPEIIAERTAELCAAAESELTKKGMTEKPLYIIGTDVPPPGGAQAEHSVIKITRPDEVHKTLELTYKAFLKRNLSDAWSRVIAIVVQPGVEFGNSDIHEYDSSAVLPLVQFIKSQPDIIYEAHSTDYQRINSLKDMVSNHFAILKVGPWLTFAFREAIFALSKIEQEWLGCSRSARLSNILNLLENSMISNPHYWKNYYIGSEGELAFLRKYSLSDRIRYYWTENSVIESLSILIRNLRNSPTPLQVISQYLPEQFDLIMNGELENDPVQMIYSKINKVLNIYNYATMA